MLTQGGIPRSNGGQLLKLFHFDPKSISPLMDLPGPCRLRCSSLAEYNVLMPVKLMLLLWLYQDGSCRAYFDGAVSLNKR
jgi:hypothetical protein